MKLSVVSVQEYGGAEEMANCLSAARFVSYTLDDFKDVKTDMDITKKCKHIFNCKVKKCNLKQFIAEHKKEIYNSIREEKLKKVNGEIRKLDEKLQGVL